MIKYLMKKYALSRDGAKGLINAVLATTFANVALMLPVSLLFMLIADFYNGPVAKTHYYVYALGIILSLVLIFITSYWQYNATYFNTYKESGVRRIRLAEKLRKLPLSFFGKKDLANLTNTIMKDSNVLEQMLSHYVPQFYGSIISSGIISIALLIYDWRLGLAALWVLPVAILIVALSKKAQNSFTRKQRNAEIIEADCIQEGLEAIRDLKSNNAQERYLSDLDVKINQVEKRHIKSELGIAMFVVPAQMILKLGIATVALIGGALLINGQIGILVFFMFLIVVSRIYEPLMVTLQNLAALVSLEVNVNRMNEIENHFEQLGNNNLLPKTYDIEFENVGFSYNKDETVLSNVTFTAKQGEVTALIGPSGGGKSTTAKLAARFWDVNSGTIKIGGIDIKTIEPELLLSLFSIVFQDVTLFNNTIMENIRIGKKDATDEEILAAAKLAQCEDFVAKLPNGYETIIGENGSLLSGGERQRISIARALLKDAPIILLDEATASLDSENETEIQMAISRLIENKTVIIIAHRMRTVENANHLVFLKDGLIKEEGTHSELLKLNGLYANMIRLQKESSKWNVK